MSHSLTFLQNSVESTVFITLSREIDLALAIFMGSPEMLPNKIQVRIQLSLLVPACTLTCPQSRLAQVGSTKY